MDRPRFACSLSTLESTPAAEDEALRRLEEGLDGRTPDLVVVFSTAHHTSGLEGIGLRARSDVGAEAVVGCTAVSVIADEREAEALPGLAYFAASMPGTRVAPFELTAARTPEGEVLFSEPPPVDDPSRASILLFADPFTFPVDAWLARLADDLPGVPVLGGLASAGGGPGQNALVTATGVRDHGALGVVIEGDVELRPVVSQGCRPIGRPWVVTGSEGNVVRALGGRRALDVLQETWNTLAAAERELLQRAPFLGVVVDARKRGFERGDFLARGILGVRAEEGSIVVGDMVRPGTSVQFLVRDAATAGEDLDQILAGCGGGRLDDGADPREVGALLFSCNGRGRRMFDQPDHDVGHVRRGLAAGVPIAGFFAAGEIGPIGGRNFLHGFTASVAVLRTRDGTS